MKKSVLVTAIACLTAVACTGKYEPVGQAYLGQVSYQGWSCEELNQEIARIDAASTESQKYAIEQVMLTKNCIHPLAAETD